MAEKTGDQVQVIFFKRDEDGIKFLIMKRVPEKGGFWQPLTGGVHVGETREETITRETLEEIGIEDIMNLIETQYVFEFTDNGRHHREYVYGAELDKGAEIQISDEHEEYKWVNKDEAMSFLKWDSNKEGLQTLCNILGI
jgi:8-oxo-dGTP pyrophosphatase MutT (NUDIX family)